jgi:GTP-binding protein
MADVGIVGMPNAGKSTLLSRLSRARPKIADYPFTTLQPQLGIVELTGFRRFVMADIPGLIAGAHEGAGLGDTFLKHIERTRILVHLVDVGSNMVPLPPLRAYRMIRDELRKYSPQLAEKPELVAANKIDLTGGKEAAAALAEAIEGRVWPISAVSGSGMAEMVEELWRMLQEAKSAPEKEERAETTRETRMAPVSGAS